MSDLAQPSFEALYSVYTPLVRKLLRAQGVPSSDLDDVLQETFVTVHRLLPSFEGRSSLSTWLHAVVWRVAANHRRRQRRMLASGRLDIAAEPTAPEPVFERESGSSYEHVEGEHRDLLALRDIGGLSISLIAELTGYARATVRSKLQRGRAALLRASGERAQRAQAADQALAARFVHDVPITSAPDARILACGLVAVTAIDDLVLALWRGPCTNTALQEVIGTLLTHARNHPAGIRYLSVVEPDSTPPDREGRDMMLWAARQLRGQVNAVAHMVEGSVRITALASIMNASILLARAGFDPHYFGELKPALTWLAQFGPLDKTQISSQIAHMKRQLGPSPGAHKSC